MSWLEQSEGIDERVEWENRMYAYFTKIFPLFGPLPKKRKTRRTNEGWLYNIFIRQNRHS